METINEKAKELKTKALAILEERMSDKSISVLDLRNCVDCINAIQKDEMFLQNFLAKGGFSGGYNGGFAGFGSKPTEENPKITCDSCDENKNKDLS